MYLLLAPHCFLIVQSYVVHNSWQRCFGREILEGSTH